MAEIFTLRRQVALGIPFFKFMAQPLDVIWTMIFLQRPTLFPMIYLKCNHKKNHGYEHPKSAMGYYTLRFAGLFPDICDILR